MYDRNKLTEWDKKYIWHPFTQMKDYMDMDTLVIEKGEGCCLFDIEGNKYIDGISSLWVIVHGHNKRELVEAIKKQAGILCHSTLLGIANVPSVVLAKMLIDISPKSLSRVFYSDNGSTSVEIALKMAYQYWQQKGEKKRKKFISFTNGYHGDTIGSVSVGGIDIFHKVYRPLLFKTYKSPSPYCYRCPLKLEKESCRQACVKKFEEIVKKHKDEICAVLIESVVQGAGGIIVQPEGFLSSIYKIAKENGLLFAVDEVAVGFGRTGSMFACEREKIEPDFLCLAKSVTGGYLPLAATLTTDEVFEGFFGQIEDYRTFFHGHTYTGNPLACSVAIENLNLYKKENILENLQKKIVFLNNGLEKFKNLSHVGEVRQAGFMVGIELVKNKKTKQPFHVKEKIGHKVIMEARKKGAIIRPLGDVIVLMPPLAIEEDLLQELIDITYESIKIVTGI